MTTSEFLDELESRASSLLGESEATDLVQELRSHIDSSVAARIELGSTLLEAEWATVEAIGDPKLIVKKLYDQKHRWVDKKLAYLLMGMYALSAGMLAFGEHTGSETAQFPNVWLTSLWFLGIGVVVWSSARLRRIQSLTCVASLLPATLIFALILSTTVAAGVPGYWANEVPFSTIPSHIQRYEEGIREKEAWIGEFRKSYATWKEKPTTQWPHVHSGTNQITMREAGTISEAQARWEGQLERTERRMHTGMDHTWIEHYVTLQQTPYWLNVYRQIYFAANQCFAYSFIFSIANMLGWTVGALWRLARRSRLLRAL